MKNNYSHDMNTRNNHTRLLRGAMLAAAMLFSYAGAQAQSHVTVGGNVYGGGNLANVGGNSSVLIDQAGAVIGTVNGGGTLQAGTGDVYGGGAFADVNTNGTNTTTVTILEGTVHGDVYGGGLGDDTHEPLVKGRINVSIGNSTKGNATIEGMVFGGNNVAGTPRDSVTVDIWSTAHNGSNGVGTFANDEAFAAYIETDAAHAASSFALKAVYGGSNKADYIPATTNAFGTRVTVHNCVNTIKMLYGGGRAAAVGSDAIVASTKVVVDGGRIDTLFAGGDGHTLTDPEQAYNATTNPYLPADIHGDVTAYVRGGYHSAVFGGSNTSGTISGTKNVTIDKSGPCSDGLNDDDQLELVGALFGGGNLADAEGDISLTIECGTGYFHELYGGCNLANVNGDVTLTVRGGTFDNVYGGSKGSASKAANIDGSVELNLYGGTMINAFGGSNINGNITGSITVNVNDAEDVSCPLVVHNVYGGGRDAAYTPTTPVAYPEVNLIKGTVSTYVESGETKGGHVFGGGLGETAIVSSNPVVNLQGGTAAAAIFGGGEAAPVTGNPTVNALYGAASNVFGGGLGSTATVTGNPTVIVNKTADKTLTVADVFGGGDAAPVTGNTSVTLQSATVSHIYGGGNQASVSGTSTVTVGSGAVTTGVYGGCNTSGTVGGAIAVKVNGGTVGTSGTHAYGVFGGGYGSSTATGDAVTVTIGDGTSTPTVYGDIYGGSAEGNVNDNSDEITKVWLRSGTVYGDIYGGGFGDNDANALVNGSVQVVVDGGAVNTYTVSGNTLGGRIFGCNNENGTPKGTVTVTVNSTAATTDRSGATPVYALQAVYGGGNLAHYDPTTPGSYPTVIVNGCTTSIKDVFGGGNAAAVPYTSVTINGGDIDRVFAGGNGESGTAANVGWKNSADSPSSGSYGDGTANALIKGGTIRQVFGGSNSKGNVRESGTLQVDKDGGSCNMYIAEVYGGGNLAAGAASTISIGCTGTLVEGASGHAAHPENIGTTLEGIGSVYGGANQANVSGNIVLTIEDGLIRNVFGGNNQSGSISGTVAVNINKKATSCGWYVYDVFGGGNVAAYSGSPVVTVTNGEVSHNVFGGGNEAGVGGSTVNINGGLVDGGVYGGCNTSGTVSGPIAVNLNDGTVGVSGVTTDAVFGGGYGELTATTGNVTVTLGDNTNTGQPVVYGALYGGSAFGSVNDAEADLTTVNILSGAIHGNIYGGGLGQAGGSNVSKGQVNGTVTVNIGVDKGTSKEPDYVGYATIDGSVYGCNNTNGSPRGSVTVNVYSTGHTTTPVDNTTAGTAYAIDQVFGGGRNADYTVAGKTATVNIFSCLNTIRRVFGGGDAAAVTGSSVTVVGGRIDYLFGGGNGESVPANIGTGGITIALHGGHIGHVINASNQQGTIGGAINVTVDNDGGCDEIVDEFFGGSNMVDITGDVSTVIECGAGTFGAVYGGSNKANIDGNVSLTVKGGTIGRVYGGSKGDLASLGSSHSDVSANITGDVTLLLNGGTIGAAFGGSNINGSIGGTITVTVNDLEDGDCPLVLDSVFGAGNLTNYSGSPTVNINNGAVRQNVYGGANQANVSGTTTVNLNSGSVGKGIYGGCNTSGTVGGDAIVNLLGGQVGSASDSASAAYGGGIYGGGYGQSTAVSGDVEINLGNLAGTATPVVFGEIYGGSALGSVNTNNSNTTTINLLSGTLHGAIYGGGLGDKASQGEGHSDIAPKVNGVVQVNVGTDNEGEYVGSASLKRATIYGGNNLNGSPQDNIYIDVYKTAHTSTDAYDNLSGDRDFAISTIYGGGNMADYAPENGLSTSSKKTYVSIHGCENTVEEVYGGGNAAAVVGTVVVIDGGRFGTIFGGGNGAVTAANVGLGGVSLTAKGGHVGYIYEHCNKRGEIAGTTTFESGGTATDCNGGVLKVDYHFCGGNEVDIVGDFHYTFSCEDNLDYLGLYGGCRLGTTYGNITLTIEGGTFASVYGGPRGDRGFAAKVRKYDAEHVPDSLVIDGVTKHLTSAEKDALIGTGGNVTIILKGGTIGNVYGGCELNGDVEGRITIVVDDAGTSCPLSIDNIYGGGDRAFYNPDTANSAKPYYTADYSYPYIQLKNGTVNNNVFGGGKGLDGSLTAGYVASNPLIVMNPDVANGKKFIVKGNIYGGGELGQTAGNTTIDIDTGTVRGTVYGGGKGSTADEGYGLVTKNTLVDISGGTVEHSVYGGGELASVGTFTEWYSEKGYDATNGRHYVAGEPKAWTDGTGLCKVLLSGNAQVGIPAKAHMPTDLDPTSVEYGYVFAASKGTVDSTLYPKANLLAVSCSTYLEISGSALITASAYGGSKNGEVLGNTYVKVTGGQIGLGWNAGTADAVYTAEQWTAAVNAVKNGTIGTSYVNPFHECAAWDYASPYSPYDIYADVEGYDAHGGSKTPSDGHTFFGCIFGGGSGYYPFWNTTEKRSQWRRSAGRVCGDTKVEITGGHILTNVYGGNETTDVLGDCQVTMTAGTVGVPRTVAQMQAHPVTCYIFGAGKGDERNLFNKGTNVRSTHVSVSGTAHVFGSVFGGGEDGHVLRNTRVDIADVTIGTTGTSYVDGNVFGGGRGFSGTALTAGNVGGNAEVNISSGTILGSVYGGGRLASVGYGLYDVSEEDHYGVMRDDNVDDNDNTVADFPRGHITVNITGGTIGNDVASDYGLSHSRGGNVYGGSMGRLTKLDGTMVLPIWHRLGAAKSTTVNINTEDNDTWVKGNVYGGSELGTVTGDIEVNISGTPTIGRKAASTTTSHGNVYGGGVGYPELTAAEKTQVGNVATSDSIPTFAGLTGGNIEVNISGGAINNNVYGAGELASVGTIATVTTHSDIATTFALSWPYEYTYSGTSGEARVNITGGTIGFISGSDTTGGDIFGSARGTVGDRYITGRLATARATHVTINLSSPSDKIVGNVYGSGENGHVYDDAKVTLTKGLVLGAVYGGGKGTDTYTDQLKDQDDDHLYDASVYDIIAGKVFGNTYVNILGGRVAKSVYGGGNLASVGKGNYKDYGEGADASDETILLAENSGHCYVNILGGTIGPDGLATGTSDNSDYTIRTGYVYGAGKGIVYPDATKVGYDYDRNYYVAYVNKTTVVIGDADHPLVIGDPAEPGFNSDNLYPHVTANVFGGGENGHVRFDTHVKTYSGQIGVRPLTKNVVSTDGHWAKRGNIFGAGRGEETLPGGGYCQSAGSVTRNTTIDILGARIYRNILGGGAMASVGPIKGYTGEASTCIININLPSDSDTLGGPGSADKTFGGYIGGGSFGIPSPDGTDNSALATCHNSQVNMRRGWLKNTIYGGGENGQMLGNTEVNVYGGYVRAAIYGGGKGCWKASAEDAGMPGTYDNDTYSGYIAGNTEVNLLGGEVPFTYGGCRRANVGGNATINIGKVNTDGTYSGEASFIVGKDKVYGGNQYAGSPMGDITVNVYKTAHTVADAATYTEDDGVHGDPAYAINVVYGGSYNSDYLPSAAGHRAQVQVYGCDNTINTVYGGCAAADAGSEAPGIGADTKLIIDGGRFNDVFGGGDGTYDRYIGAPVAANIYGTATTEIHGGTIGSLFGGSNTLGAPKAIDISVDGDGPCGTTTEGDVFFAGSNVADLNVSKLSATLGCGANFKAAYGGSNKARINGDVELTIKGGTIDTVYGGSRGDTVSLDPANSHGGHIHGNVTVNLYGGTLGDVYGGGNLNGVIDGIITVNVDSIQNTCELTISGNVYGGGNLTPSYAADANRAVDVYSPIVNIKHGSVGIYGATVDADHGNVYGAGHGQGSRVRSNPKVVIGNGTYSGSYDYDHDADGEETTQAAVSEKPIVYGNVYGAGMSSRTFGHTTVLVQDGLVHGDVFGGGRGFTIEERPTDAQIATRAIVDGWTTISMTDGTVEGNIYGGGEIASVGHYSSAAQNNGIEWSDYGSRSSDVQAKYGNTYITISGGIVGPGVKVMDKTDVGAANLAFVYGGGKGIGGNRDADYKNYTNVANTSVTVNGGHIFGSVFGGAEDGHVTGNTNVYIQPGAFIGSEGYTHEYDGCILGGGRNDDNKTNVDHLHAPAGRVGGNTNVSVTGGRILRSVFGGGAMARVGVDVDGGVDSYVSGTVYSDSTLHGTTFVNVSGDTVVYADQAAFEASTHYALYKGTTRTDASGRVIVYLTAIGAPDGEILVDNDYTIGDIFGGGKGDTKDTLDFIAGRVMNTYVVVSGYPRVMADIYAGAEMGSVGWWDTNRYVGAYGSSATNANHNVDYSHTGYTHVTISDNPYTGTPYEFSTANYIDNRKAWTIVDALGRLTHTCSGNVYGGGQGYVEEDATHRTNWVHMGRVRHTNVTISGGRFMGNVFGGGSRGIVKENCHVDISGGRIGCIVQDASKNTDDTPKYHDGRYFCGSVFGGGYGNPKTFSHLNDSSFVTSGGDRVAMIPAEQAGRVYGNTYVNISGGQILDCVYGGGDLASTGWVERDPATGRYLFEDASKRHGGVCTVNITGNTVVGPLDYFGHNAYVYGAGRGVDVDQLETYKLCANVNETHLTVNLTTSGAPEKGADAWDAATDGGRIWGSLFGGGADCHVLGNVYTTLSAGLVGTDSKTTWDGNIFGGGRNYHNSNHTNGRVQGNTYVLMNGGTILGSLFGGGRLALSGVNVDGLFPSSDWTVADHGNVGIHVSGNAHIGTDNAEDLFENDQSVGDIFGSGKGDVNNYEDVLAGRVTNATITIKDSLGNSPVIRGSVFGGGEMASIGYWDNTGDFYSGTGVATLNILAGTIGTAAELTYEEDDNPGQWTIYDANHYIVHTCTGNVYGGSQGDVDPESPAWVSMGRSASATVTVGTSGSASGPSIMGHVFGGAEQGIVTGNTRVNVYSGTVGTLRSSTGQQFEGDRYGGVYGAGYGCDDPSEYSSTAANDSTNHRASGLDALPGTMAGRVYGDTRVDILGGTVNGTVFGGASYAYVGYEPNASSGNTTVNIGSGTLDANGYATAVSGNATILGDIYGANNLSGTPFGNTNVNIYRTAHTSDSPLVVDVVTIVSGNQYPSGLKEVEESTSELTSEDIASAKLTTADRQSLVADSRFALHAVYGGGNRAAHDPIASTGTTNVHVYMCEENTIHYVYGGGNAADTKNNNVVIDGGYIRSVFGGGNGFSATGNHSDINAPNYNPGADVSGTATTEIRGGLIDSVFAGSNQLGFVPNANLITNNDSGCEELINNTYGGGNETGTGGGIVTLSCNTRFENFYAGAQNADVGTLAEWNAGNPANIVVNIEGGTYTNFFGGNNQSGTIYGNVVVNYHGGNILNLFGGCNEGGHIMGTVTVNVDVNPDYDCSDGLGLSYVYGGGKDAPLSPEDPFHATPMVNIMNNRYLSGSDSLFVRILDVFGGGLGETAVVKGYPRVVVGGFPDTTVTRVHAGSAEPEEYTYTRGVHVYGNVYGGGSSAPVDGNICVFVRDAVIGEQTNHNHPDGGMVFGGGYGPTSTVQGSTYVGLSGRAEIMNNVYGGGNAGVVLGQTTVGSSYMKQVFPPEINAYNDNGTIKARLTVKGMDVDDIYYTTDGTRPDITDTSQRYDGTPFAINFDAPVQAIAVKEGYLPSPMMHPQSVSPVITIDDATHKATFSGPNGSKIYYTLDGSDPATSATRTLWGTIGESEGAPVTIPTADVDFEIAQNNATSGTGSLDPGHTLRAMAEMRSCSPSPTSFIQADQPVITLSGNVATITAKAGERIIFTLEGTTPVSMMDNGTLLGERTGDHDVSTVWLTNDGFKTEFNLSGFSCSRGESDCGVVHYKRTFTDAQNETHTVYGSITYSGDSGAPTITITLPTSLAGTRYASDGFITIKAVTEHDGYSPSQINAVLYRP